MSLRRLLTGLGLVTLMLLGQPAPTMAQEVERVRFAPGRDGAVLQGGVTGYDDITYLVGANAGQHMVIDFGSSNASAAFNVFAPGSSDEAIFIGSVSGSRFDMILPESGTYRVQVYLMRNAARRNESTNYVLDLRIRAARPDFADGLSGGPDWWVVTGVAAGDLLNLREGPGTRFARVASLANGQVMQNRGCRQVGSTRWCRISTPDGVVSGWAAGRFLRESAGP